MRVLFLSDFYPPVLGGLELQVQAIAHGLSQRGHRSSVATLTLQQPDIEQDHDVRVHRLRGWNRALAPFYEHSSRPFHPTLPDPGVMKQLHDIVQAEQPDVVYAHSWIVYSYLPIKSRASAKLALMLHDYGAVCPKKTFVYRESVCAGPSFAKCIQCASGQYGKVRSLALTTGMQMMRRTLGTKTDLVVADSRAVAVASAQGVMRTPEEVLVIPESVPDAVFHAPSRPRPDFVPKSGDYLLFVGALGKHKGLDVLLAAYRDLQAAVPLVLAGVPRKDTPTCLPPGVTIVRDVPNDEVLAAWAHCTIALVPSVWPEPFGIVATEAMASGRPVIASAVGGLQDIVVHGETGLLVPPGDVAALGNAITRLLSNPGEREFMGRQGKQRAYRYSASKVLDDTEVHLQALVEPTGEFIE